MAKKTNKTEHVLSLLSGAGTTTDKEKEESGNVKKESPAQSVPVTEHQGNVHVVMAPGTREDPVAEAVKEKLQEELRKLEEPEVQVNRTEIIAVTEPPVFQENIPTEKQEEVEPFAADEFSMPEPDPDPEPEPEEMEGYVFYNIMERIVKDKAMKYMKQFGNCTCRRCEADTIALALSKLPPKYVVAKEDSVSPLVNFYEDHYAGQVIVEITKACIVVNRNPRHSTK